MNPKITLAVLAPVLISILLITTCSSKFTDNKSKDEFIELKWKILPNDSLVYQTVMTEIGESTFEMDFGGFFDSMLDSHSSESKIFGKEFFKTLKESLNNTDLITVLTPSKYFENVIDIVLFAEKKEAPIPEESDEQIEMMEDRVSDDEEMEVEDQDTSEFDPAKKMINAMKEMLKGVLLRGSVNTNGTLHSFWLKSSQKNLISIFFELPGKPIRVGDTWILHNVNFIGNDHNFVCEEAKKRNIVKLIEIKKEKGQTIAVIEYDLYEYVSGEFNAPTLFLGGSHKEKTVMTFVFKALAEFSIEEGKWISYNGIMALKTSGVMTTNQKQKFALIER